MAKTICPLSKAEFLEKAEAVQITVAGTTLMAEKKAFATGSFGWYLSGKAVVMVDGKPVQVQVGVNMAVIGSKEAK